MNSSLMVHYAVACLEALDVPRKPEDVSRSQGLPLNDCLHILRKFESAGLVRENAGGFFERTRQIEELTALQVLQALWAKEPAPVLQMLYVQDRRHAGTAMHKAARIAEGPQG